MKRSGYLVERIADTDNLLLAYTKARRGKQMKKEFLAFSNELDANIAKLRSAILAGNPEVGNYYFFRINDPKPRLICASSLPERVLHHAIFNVCQPYFERQLIETTYATRIGKGVYKALDRAKGASRCYKYVAKFDFRRFFDSVDHDILKTSLRRLFKDAVLLQILDAIIDSYEVGEGKGIPIGNLTSQYFANFYLAAMDHRIKETLHVAEYIRYMDDFLVYANTKEELDKVVDDVRQYSKDVLKLTLKPVTKLKTGQGVPFLGYKVYPHKVLLNSRSKRRLKAKMNHYEELRLFGRWNETEYYNHITPLMAFAKYANSKGLRMKIIKNQTGVV